MPGMAAIQPVLDKICASPQFCRSSRLQRFIRYVTEWAIAHPGEALKEYAIAVAVYDKRASFDPQADPIVRVEAGRLRARLLEYYDGAGREDPLILDLPKGSYLPLLRRRQTELGAPIGQSLAVTPFPSVTPFPDDEPAGLSYLANGLSEAITCRLALLSSARVAPWSMVLRMQEPPRDLAQMAQQLGVRTLVVLRVVEHASVYELHIEWLDPVQKTHLWGAQYRCESAGLSALHEEVSRDLAGRLGLALQQPQPRISPGHRPTSNGRAYQLYLKGRHLWNKRTAHALLRATEYFNRAIDQDPGFALAFAGLADCHLTLGSFGFLAPSDSLPRAKVAAMRAVGIDRSLGEAWTVLACVSALLSGPGPRRSMTSNRLWRSRPTTRSCVNGTAHVSAREASSCPARSCCEARWSWIRYPP